MWTARGRATASRVAAAGGVRGAAPAVPDSTRWVLRALIETERRQSHTGCLPTTADRVRAKALPHQPGADALYQLGPAGHSATPTSVDYFAHRMAPPPLGRVAIRYHARADPWGSFARADRGASNNRQLHSHAINVSVTSSIQVHCARRTGPAPNDGCRTPSGRTCASGCSPRSPSTTRARSREARAARARQSQQSEPNRPRHGQRPKESRRVVSTSETRDITRAFPARRRRVALTQHRVRARRSSAWRSSRKIKTRLECRRRATLA